jgi:hypothetical protein
MIQMQNSDGIAAMAIPGQSNAYPKKTNWRMSLVVVLLAACALIAYSNCYSVPYIFDDLTSIRDNRSIRHWQTALAPNLKNGETVSGRSLLNVSFAIN